MKQAQFAAINKRISAKLPSFGFKGGLLCMNPIKQLVRALDFASSSYNKTSFDVEMFVLPLCRPTSYIYYTYGERIRSPRGEWDARMADLEGLLVTAIQERALPYLESMSSLDAFIGMAEASYRTERTLEALAYAQVRVGAFREAAATLDEMGLIEFDHTIPWQKELEARMASLRAQVSSDPAQAQADVIAIEAQTVRSLGLEKFWVGAQA